ncbi:MAG: hypothetical protein KGL42_09670 [Betaproteobacteria bacterium]|nr:hypothetical protein [Betaproteobacteria bacterium]
MTTVRVPCVVAAEAAATTQGELARQGTVAACLGLADVSGAARWGCKGPGTAAWMQTLGLPLAPEPNSWRPLQGSGLIARLGFTEYLVDGPPELIDRLEATPRCAGVYPVLRQDAALLLGGSRLDDLLRETCSVDFRPFFASASAIAQQAEAPAGMAQGDGSQPTTAAGNPGVSLNRSVVITSMVGVGVTVIPEWRAGRAVCRIWCDGTYGHYLWHTLLDIATSLGGGAVAPHDLMDGPDFQETSYDLTTCGARS